MGIPVYFKTLVQEYENTILNKEKLSHCNSLFLDLNCAIHPCCQGETDESIMIQKIIDKINELVEYTNVTDLLYIAIDGIPPKGKMKQQRMRRHKSILEKKPWDTNAISPGTIFMEKLNVALRKWIQNQKIQIIFSDSNERGEGEHKILQYIKKNDIQTSVIYGLDADLIMLSLVSQKENISLLRERTEYNIENTDNDYIYLMIDELKKFIVKDIGINAPELVVLNDYIFICFLLGNDFVNHLPSLSLRYNGYDALIETYKMLQERYQGYFKLIDVSLENCIHFTFFKEFILELSFKESELLQKKAKIREKQYKRIYNQYHETFGDFKKNYPTQGEILSLEDIYSFQNDNPLDQETRKEMISNLPILYYPEEKKHKIQSKPELCKDYLESLIWTSHYYFKECVNWKWCTQYESGPLLKDLFKYVSYLKQFSFPKDNQEYTIQEQLKFIFPKESHKLHRHKMKGKNYNLMICPYFSRYLWECHIIFESHE